MTTLISIIVPVFNEAQNLASLWRDLSCVITNLEFEFEVIFVDDGSSDDTSNIIQQLHSEDSRVKGVHLTRNFGHQNALRAGLDYAKGEAIIMMDGDFQHPPKLIPEFIKKWQEGYNTVHSIRSYDSYNLKSSTSLAFYHILNKLSPIKIHPGMADFRLIDRKILELLKKFPEYQIFYRGLIPLIGLKQTFITYSANERFKGVSKYSLKSMIQLAINGITSLSTMPLYFSIILGMMISILSLFYGLYVIAVKFYWGDAISGWTSLMLSVLLIGGIQMILLGIIGIYIAKIFHEVKKRPPYLVSKISE
jgi:glycosyltransferase involved in cell wall biosynthesis